MPGQTLKLNGVDYRIVLSYAHPSVPLFMEYRDAWTARQFLLGLFDESSNRAVLRSFLSQDLHVDCGRMDDLWCLEHLAEHMAWGRYQIMPLATSTLSPTHPDFEKTLESTSLPKKKPPRTESRAEIQSWIEIELVDHKGGPVADERFVLKTSSGATVLKGQLDKNGWTRVDKIKPGDYEVTFSDLKPREVQNGKSTAAPTGEVASFAVAAGEKHSFRLRPRLMRVLEIEDLLFNHDSAVFLPRSQEQEQKGDGVEHKQARIKGLAVLKTVLLRSREYSKQQLLIAGHTDTSGKPKYNRKLSMMRAKSVLHLLLNQRDFWVEIAEEKHKKSDIQAILSWAAQDRGWSCDPKSLGQKKALSNFQTAYKKAYSAGLSEKGKMDTKTWEAFFELYQRRLTELLDTDEAGMEAYRNGISWVTANTKAVGCGETWPIDKPEKSNYKSQINRRVELLFFDADEAPDSLDCPGVDSLCDKESCPIYSEKARYRREYLPLHPHPRAQGTPTFYTIEQPGAKNYVKMHSLWAYVVQGNDVDRYAMHEGKLCVPGEKKPCPIDCDPTPKLYFSHRDDLTSFKTRARFFASDKSALPLLGPVTLPAGRDGRIDLDIWQQNDWAIVRGPLLDGARPDGVKMCEWDDSYKIGELTEYEEIGWRFDPHTRYDKKDQQERWQGSEPIDFVLWAKPEGDPMWVGTLSALPSDRAKILLVHKSAFGLGDIFVTSYNELKHEEKNIDLPGHHRYDQALVQTLLALPGSDQPATAVDGLRDPPPRCLLPGDICYQDQGRKNACGPYSFAFAMNYWFPCSNNPHQKNGVHYDAAGRVDDVINGARTPKNIVDAAARFNMHGRDNDASDLSQKRALKLLKLWIHAGVPVLVLVIEARKVSTYHWKTVVGYDEKRFFFNNSGADYEANRVHRTPGVEYELAPVGNDVDSHSGHWTKWKGGGGDILDALFSGFVKLTTSVNACTFIPIYPKDSRFSGKEKI